MSGNLPPIEALVDRIRERGDFEESVSPVIESSFGNNSFTWVLCALSAGVMILVAIAVYVDPFRR